MGDITEQRAAGIVGARKVLAVVEELSRAGIGREILVRECSSPPRGVLNGLKACRHQRIGIGLFDSAAVEWRITFVLQTPIETVQYPVNAKVAVPFRQFDPSVGAVREKVLIGVEREVLLIEVAIPN